MAFSQDHRCLKSMGALCRHLGQSSMQKLPQKLLCTPWYGCSRSPWTRELSPFLLQSSQYNDSS